MHRWIEIARGIRITGHGAAWLPEASAVVVADIHLGYARAARRRGGYLPRVESAATLADRLLALVVDTGATRLVIAGDLRHSTRDADEAELRDVDELRARLDSIGRVEIVAGNHDRGMPGLWPTVRIGDVDVVHAPPTHVPERWTLCGHLHPSTAIRDETGASLRLPCALVGPRIVVLPAFTEWAGGTLVSRLLPTLPTGEWRTLATAGGWVYDAA